MQPEQEQIQRTYTFEEINPDFSKILSENGGFMECKDKLFESNDGVRRSINECGNCIVGEAMSIVDEPHGE